MKKRQIYIRPAKGLYMSDGYTTLVYYNQQQDTSMLLVITRQQDNQNCMLGAP